MSKVEKVERAKRSYITATKKDADIRITVEELDALCDMFDLAYISLNEYDPTYMSHAEINITDGEYNTKTFKLPAKKPVDKAWVVGRINAMQKGDKAYADLRDILREVASQFEGMNIYATSYGIGIHTLFTDTDAEFKAILDMLDAHDVDYRLEWSKAMWVKRIIVSKSADNLAKIEMMKKERI